MNRKRFTQVLAAAAFAAALPLAASAQAPDWKKVRIGVEGAYPPFSEMGPDGRSRASTLTWPTRCVRR